MTEKSKKATPKRKRTRKKKRAFTPARFTRVLKKNRLAAEDYTFFKDVFVGQPFSYILKMNKTPLGKPTDKPRRTPRGNAPVGREPGRGITATRAVEPHAGGTEWWMERKRRVTDLQLLRHIAGELWIGTGARWDKGSAQHTTRFAAIDLDSNGDESDLRARYTKVIEALGQPSLVFRSSLSGGLHVYYIFPEEVELWDLVRDWSGKRGAVVELLAGVGLTERSGTLEVYPRGSYKSTGPQNRLRLPFGADCILLSSDKLEPRSDKTGAALLALVRSLWEQGRVCLTDVLTLVSRASVYGRRESQTDLDELQRSPTRIGIDHLSPSDVGALWENGLCAFGTMNKAVSALAFDCRRRGYAEMEAAERIVEWLAQSHNGKSHTYNASAERARSEVRAVVERVYQHAGTHRDYGPLPTLTPAEDQVVERLATDVIDPTTGEEIPLEEARRFATDIVRHAKQWVVSEVMRVSRTLDCDRPDLQQRSDAYVQLLAQRLPADWPADGIGYFPVPIPKKLRRRWLGYGKDRGIVLWRALLHSGQLRQVRIASKHAHRAATYAVWLELGDEAQSLTAWLCIATHGFDIEGSEDRASPGTNGPTRAAVAAQYATCEVHA